MVPFLIFWLRQSTRCLLLPALERKTAGFFGQFSVRLHPVPCGFKTQMESPGPAFRGTSHSCSPKISPRSTMKAKSASYRSSFDPVWSRHYHPQDATTRPTRNFPDMPGANCRLTLMGSTVVGGNSRLSFIRSYPVFSHDSGTSSYGADTLPVAFLRPRFGTIANRACI